MNHFEWHSDQGELSGPKDKLAREIMGDDHAENYQTPKRSYDNSLEVDQEYIDSLPDLQNGPSSLIQGAQVSIQQVGIHHFRIPLKFAVKDDGEITLETSVTGTVSLEAHKKGINMSRIMRSFYDYKDTVFKLSTIERILEHYKNKLESFDARIMMKISYPILLPSLRSENAGYQYYDITLEGVHTQNGTFQKYMHFDFVYSSACPCSFELSQHAVKYRNQAVVPHSQRSVARVSVQFEGNLWFEDVHAMCLEALKTETQVVVKREDEQAFAELNGSNLKFVEDAVRLLYEELNKNEKVVDFRVIASHQESLHSHDAIAVIAKGIPGGFQAECPREVYNSLIHVPR
ncbi:MAG: GTP cyclohydrolase FolE2 [Lentisphaeria bacterium]|nr:GTP cyclohydrolase FolE2 [Lentisphaeria bacterium]